MRSGQAGGNPLNRDAESGAINAGLSVCCLVGPIPTLPSPDAATMSSGTDWDPAADGELGQKQAEHAIGDDKGNAMATNTDASTGIGQATSAQSAQPAPEQAASNGRFGRFGGRYVPETLIPALDELDAVHRELAQDADFQKRFRSLLRDYVGRPTPLSFAARLSERFGRRIWLKREDLNHTGAHKINNAIGQALVAQHFWVNNALLPKLVPVSMALPPPRPARCLASIAGYTWGLKTCVVSSQTCTVCACWAPTCMVSRVAQKP